MYDRLRGAATDLKIALPSPDLHVPARNALGLRPRHSVIADGGEVLRRVTLSLPVDDRASSSDYLLRFVRGHKKVPGFGHLSPAGGHKSRRFGGHQKSPPRLLRYPPEEILSPVTIAVRTTGTGMDSSNSSKASTGC